MSVLCVFVNELVELRLEQSTRLATYASEPSSKSDSIYAET